MTILVVDDYAPFRELARAVLAEDGFEVIGDAADGATAVAEARRLRPSVAIVDIHLGEGIDGFEVARQLAELEFPPEVVLTSSRDAMSFGARLADAPVRGFVAKDELSASALRALLRAPTTTPRLVVADDSVLFREGLARILSDLGYEVAAQADSPTELLEAIEAHSPDLAIVDIRMPPNFGLEGIQAADEIGVRFPQVGVLLLSHHLESSYAEKLLRHHPDRRGYLLKDHVGDLDALDAAIRRLHEGGTVVDPDVVDRLMTARASSQPELLNQRETEVLTLMAEGLSNAGISQRLFLSNRTVEGHVTRIFSKLGLPAEEDQNRRVLAVLTMLRAGVHGTE